jgi:Uma2 family endonuclease
MIKLPTEPPLSPPSAPGPHCARDYFALPDEPRCELIYGRLYMSPAPTSRHQEIVGMLYTVLDAAAQQTGGRALMSPIDVVLGDHSVVQPDLVYLSASRRDLIRDQVDGAPDLVIEVLSPGSHHRDRVAKLRLYAMAGVGECWLVDPDTRTFEFLVNRRGRFVVSVPEDDVHASPVVPGLSLDVAAFWQAFRRRSG